MTLPNKLTLLRILLIPVLIIFYYIPGFDEILFLSITTKSFIIGLIFVIASLTDLLDGMIARKYNLVTTFGKFADPLADKMLVFSVMLLLLDQGLLPVWMLIVIIIREFMVSGIRMVVVERGKVIAASKLGKYKTAFTMLAITILLFIGLHELLETIGIYVMYIAVLLTIVSGIEYFWKNKEVILETI